MAEAFAPYSSGIIGLMVLVIFILILGPLVAGKKGSAGLTPGSEPAHNYGDAIYRWHRAHINATEVYAGFAVPAVLAMLLGVAPAWVNGLIWGTVVLRAIYTVIYLQGIGKPSQGVRTAVFVLAWVLNVILVIMVIAAAV